MPVFAKPAAISAWQGAQAATCACAARAKSARIAMRNGRRMRTVLWQFISAAWNATGAAVQTESSMNSAFQGEDRRSSRATVTGSLKRRGPALPGLM